MLVFKKPYILPKFMKKLRALLRLIIYYFLPYLLHFHAYFIWQRRLQNSLKGFFLATENQLTVATELLEIEGRRAIN